MTPGCRPGFCGLPPLHVSGASIWCMGSCIITSVGIHTYVNMFTLQVLGQCCSQLYGVRDCELSGVREIGRVN